jgi:hypothetical protein
MSGQVGGFKETAEFFEARARKTPDDERKSRAAETATFYRSLAAVTPTFPAGYKEPARNGNRWRNRAEECRTIAEGFHDPGCRRQMTDLAGTYDRMAKNCD